MLKCGDFVRVMNAIRTDSVLVGTVIEIVEQRVKVLPTFGDAKWVDATECEQLIESDL